MPNMELVLNMLAEVSSTEIAKSSDYKSKESAVKSVIDESNVANNTNKELEIITGKKIVLSSNKKTKELN